MNIFLPQSIQTMVELQEIADVKRQIITPRTSTPIIGIVQDGLLGAYNLTDPNMRIDWKDAMNIISYTSLDDFPDFKKNKQYSGTELFSMIIPSKINVDRKDLKVEAGIIKEGQISKTYIGSGKQNSLIHLIWDEYGIENTQKFIDDTQRLVNNFNLLNGFTAGFGDIDIAGEIEDQVQKTIETIKLEIKHLITEMENNPDLMDADIFEETLNSKLNAVLGNVGKFVMENLKKDNNFNIMISSGAKGSSVNMCQIGALLGQNNVMGARIAKKVNGRTLAYFAQNDDRASARGFVQQSFLKGMTPVEFVFHNQGSREGLIDTAIKTAESGYLQRKLIKFLEDCKVAYDLTIRSGTNSVVQFTYGDSGIDTTKQYEHTLHILTMGNIELSNNYKFTSTEIKNYPDFKKLNDSHFEELKQIRNNLRDVQMRIANNRITFENKYMLPVNLTRIIANVRQLKTKEKQKLSPKYVLDKLADVLEYKNTLLSCMHKSDATNKDSIKYRDEMVAKTLFKASLYNFLSPKLCIFKYNFNKEQFDDVIRQIIISFNKHVVQAGEMVGVIAAQSIGEPITQLTLNSIDWNDKIIILENGKMNIIEIGKYIDEKIKNSKDVQHLGDNKLQEMGDTYYLETKDDNIMTISVNKDGEIRWKKVSALTKHLPMNTDGTSDLVKITTRLGRSVTATKAKSFLTRIDNEIVPIRGDELKIGTFVPIMTQMPECEKLNELDLEMYLPKTVYKYSSEIEKAREVRNSGDRCWFKKNNGKLFTVPYSRSDHLNDVLNGKKKQVMKPNCVYPTFGTRVVSNIPEKLPLDNDFGFFVGAYLAEGLCTKTYVCISNNDLDYRQRIYDFCDKYDIGHHTTIQNDKIQEGWTSTDIRIHSTLLAELMIKMCNTGSEHKFIPSWIFQANDEFVKELLNGYFCGDGHVCKRNSITASSVSEALIDDLVLLLTRFNIMSKKSIPKKRTYNSRGSKDIKQHYDLSIRNNNVKRFNQHIIMTLKDKSDRLKSVENYNFRFGNGQFDIVPGNKLKCLKGTVHKNKIHELLGSKKISKKDKTILKKVIYADVYYDEIVKIEIVQPSHKYVYDLTVDDDKTFVSYSGIANYDTFHSAGIGAMGTTTLGVPRMKEILNFSKNMKTPVMMVYLDESYRTDKEVADKIASSLKHTILRDIRKRVDIYYDPEPFEKGNYMEKDEAFNIFYSHNPTKNSCQQDISGLPWLMRIELDKEKLMEKEISLLDIKSKFCDYWGKRFTDIRGIKREEKQILERITHCAILSNSDNSKTPLLHIRFDMKDFNFGTIIGFLDKFIETFKLKGIDDIDKILSVTSQNLVSFDNEDENKEIIEEYAIYTAGINLVTLRYMNGIDLYRTKCNDIIKIYETFGIEAARAVLFKEINSVFDNAGKSINHQHISILVDIMTNNGILVSIDRHGLNKLDTDPLSKASFEKTVDQLLSAAVFGEIDSMESVSSRIMAGLVINGGTGLCNIILDTNLLENSEYVEDIEHKYKKTFKEIVENPVMNDILKKKETNIFIPA